MSLFDKIRIRLNEVKKEPPIESGSVDPANQQGTFRKNERNKKKIMRRLEPKGPKQGELFDTSKVGKKDPVKNVKNVSDITGGKKTGIRGRKPVLPGSTPKPKKPRVIQPNIRGVEVKDIDTAKNLQNFDPNFKKNPTYKKVSKKINLQSVKNQAKYPEKFGKQPRKGTTPVRVNVKKPINVDKIFSGTGNVKKGGNVPDKNINPKSKGTTPVKTNISRVDVNKVFDEPKNPITKTIGVKQSEVSKQAKEFTAKVNKRRAQRIKSATGGKKTGSLRKGNLSFPGDRSGAYQSTKSDIETKKLLKKAGASGDVSPTAGSKIRKRVETIRKTRAAKLGLDDPFDIDTSKASKEVAKKFGTKPVKGGLDFGKPGTGVKDTIKNFQPRDISAKTYAKKVDTGLKKASKSFSQFSRDLQDFKDRDVPGGPKKTTVRRTRVSFQTPGGRQRVGMAPKNKMPTGQEFINKYKKGHPMNPEIEGIDFNKPKKNPPINVTGGSGGGKKPPKVTYGAGPTPQGPREPRKIKKIFAPGSTGKVKTGLARQDKFFKAARKITKAYPGAKPITRTLAKLGPQGRAAAAIGTVALSSPTIRKALGGALLGAGLGTFANKKDDYSKQLKLGDGIKAIGPVKSTYSLSKPKFDKGTKVSGGYVQNPKDVAKMKEKRKNYTPTKK